MAIDNIFENNEFMESAMNAWNSLTFLLEPEDGKIFEDKEEFKSFYLMIIDRLLTEEVEE